MKRYGPPKLEERWEREEIYKAFYECDAHVATIAKALECSRSTLENFLERSPHAKEIFQEAKRYRRKAKMERYEDVMNTHVENTAVGTVSMNAIKYYLDTHGKEEGYGKDLEGMEKKLEQVQSENEELKKANSEFKQSQFGSPPQPVQEVFEE